MKKLKLNKDMGKAVLAHNYELSEKERYIINLEEELNEQMTIQNAVKVTGLEAMKDYWNWLDNNGFSTEMPNPTNHFVEKFYGVETLWKTDLSQGLVVKNKDDNDYYILMECSRENEGFKYTQIILTLGG